MKACSRSAALRRELLENSGKTASYLGGVEWRLKTRIVQPEKTCHY
jgi:hypothetical protein